MRIDQLIPAFHRRDAIGDTAFAMRNFLRSKGFVSEIYCLNHDPELADEARLFEDFPPPAAGDVTILHYALPSPLTAGFAKLPSRKAIVYHNITPERFFAPYNAEMARICRLGREELAALAPSVDLALADSEYNRRELEDLGYRKTGVLPLFIDFAKYDRPMSRFVHDLYRDDRTNILFVGRIAPNKKIEDLIRTTFYYKKYVSPLVRLIVVGKTSALPKYYAGLVRMADEFYLKPEEILFTGHVPDAEMFALYRASDVFLSLSEHEGFCLPLIESMVFDLPVIAYNAGAVPGTLDGAGVLIGGKRPDCVGELVDRVARDRALRAKIIEGQRRRLERYRAADLGAFLLEKIGEMVR
ncbi:MAG: glycosyltransferase family 4 protein [Candidatus Aminicenantales bacterium]